MVSNQEGWSRIQDFFRFTRQEVSGLALAVLVAALIFSFRDWGDTTFSVVKGVHHFLQIALIAGLSFGFRVSCQKIYALWSGYTAEFRVWWAGLLLSLLLAFVTFGRVPLLLIGGITATFMVRQRLGEFRYGFSYWESGIISLWAVYASLILAIAFGIGHYLVPETYFFQKGLWLNLIMGLCALVPVPQLEGVNIFFAARWLLFLALGMVLLEAVLLLTRTLYGVLIPLILGVIISSVYLLISSEK